MKKLLLIPILALLMIGCATNRAVFNTLAAVKHTTDASVSAYFDLVAHNQAPIKGVPVVAKAYDTFEVVFETAVRAAQFNTNSPPTAPVLKAAGEVSAAIINAKGMQ